MRILITGGAGFIGSNIATALTARGDYSIRVLDNLSSGFQRNLDGLKNAEFIFGDVRDPKVVSYAMKDVNIVFHLAASVGNKRSIDHPIQDAEINVIGTLRVLEAARRAGVQRLVLSSSAGIFGELKTLPIGEDHPLAPDSPYGCTKLCAEKQWTAYGKLYGMETVSLRYFNVYGPRQMYDAYGNVIPIFAFNLLKGEEIVIFGDGEQTRDFLNVRDVAQANLKAALTPGLTGVFNIGSGQSISINALVSLIQKLRPGANPRVRYGPERKGDVRDSTADITLARKAFGYAPTVTLESGISEYLDWAESELI
jgi:nucleoside-diphosphate-sugar epimerase